MIPAGLEATLVLVRHGESTWLVQRRFQGRRNPWLSALGRAQAAAVAARLADPLAPPTLPIPPGPPVAVWHSPLKRARDTAAPIAERLRAPLVADPRLTEIGQGTWEARTHRAVRTESGALLEAWRRDPLGNVAPGGETLEEVRARVVGSLGDVLASLSAAASDGPAIAPWGAVVSHEGTLRVATLILLDQPLSDFWEYPYELGAITVVAIGGGRARLLVHNDRSHLAALDSAVGDRWGAL